MNCPLQHKSGIKYCSKCCEDDESVLIVSSKRVNKEGEIKYAYTCRKCNTERARNYRATRRGKANIYKASYSSQKRNSLQTNARQKLNYQVKIGNIVKPSKCSICKETKRIHGHHNDYLKPLEVMWVCRQCHADIHRRLKVV